MVRNLIYMAFVLCIAVLSGCQQGESTLDENLDTKIMITSNNMDRIVGMQWILQKMVIDGQEYQDGSVKPFIKFQEDGKLSGFASVNRFFGSVQIDENGSVKWSPLGSTRMAGLAELMRQEDAFLKALDKTSRFSLEKNYLYMQNAAGQTELVFYVPVK